MPGIATSPDSVRRVRTIPTQPVPAVNPVAGYALAVAGVATATLLAGAAQRWLGVTELSPLYMLCVVLVASRTRAGPALVAALLSFFNYNFFFIEPRYSLLIHSWQGVVTMALFLCVALLAGRLASRLSMQVEALQRAGRDARTRQELARALASAAAEGDVVAASRIAFEHALGATIWLRRAPGHGDAGTKTHDTGWPPPIVESVEDHGWWLLPLQTGDQTLGSLGLKCSTTGQEIDPTGRELARAMCGDIAQALHRIQLAEALHLERLAIETERLRSALLSSVSHDLRTPLACVIGAAGSLENYGDAIGDEDRAALLATIRSEGERLDRYIQNLLDMTRLGHGNVRLAREWIDVDELVGAAVTRLRQHQPQARLAVSIARDIGPVWVQPALVEQALYNVIENALHFSPPGQDVTVQAVQEAGGVLCIEVVDRGPGIPEGERERIFDMFYSVRRGDRRAGGTGLGLAICRGVMVAHGGSADAVPGRDGVGTILQLRLPPARAPDVEAA